jgi:hypothetical protein
MRFEWDKKLKYERIQLNEPSKTDWTRIDEMTDEMIDTSDIPPLDEAFSPMLNYGCRSNRYQLQSVLIQMYGVVQSPRRSVSKRLMRTTDLREAHKEHSHYFKSHYCEIQCKDRSSSYRQLVIQSM